ncbi:hypothetical protein M0638_10670 [Roseomonas sp. NAR14]|uniref:Lipoprotein n=1 Tax=Roseomonas acroporae TaxID=2937791 RepID=A0A9X2BXC6_9PROT|nr:hypothetical protein [Roseomonas acroporae]MCK8784845.1 hypothetical protein [Roseomonas acroporae]
MRRPRLPRPASPALPAALLASALALAACSWQRTQLAGEARGEMRGMTREQVLACMGQPLSTRREGGTEFLRYSSAMRAGGAETLIQRADRRLGDPPEPVCTVEVALEQGRVDRLRYTDEQGRPLQRTGQCAVAVQNCLQD